MFVSQERPAQWNPTRRQVFRHQTVPVRARKAGETLTWPASVLFLLVLNGRIHPGYGLTVRDKVRLGYRLWRTTRHVTTGTSYKAHMAMAAALLRLPPKAKGVVVECGCFQGGSTANLSIICDVVGRDLIVYDSFEGLPEPTPGDKYAKPEGTGLFHGPIDVVKANVETYGVIERCTFRKGWFADTLPHHTEPVVLAFLDVDYQASLHDCIQHLWPRLHDRGYVFIDEYVLTDYCALFWSERYWRTYFDTTPPGLIGSGSGVGVGQYYLGPHHEGSFALAPTSVAYTRKDFSGYWDFYPEDHAGDR